MIGVVGLLVLYGIAFLLSNNRRAVSWRLVAWGIGMQFLLAVIIIKTEPGRYVFAQMGKGVAQLLEFADKGSEFVFGPLADPANFGLIFAFKVLPIIIFISSLFTVLYYLGVMQRIVLLMAKVMHRFLGVSGSESLGAAANVFMGQTEAPIIVAPYIPQMTTSELEGAANFTYIARSSEGISQYGMGGSSAGGDTITFSPELPIYRFPPITRESWSVEFDVKLEFGFPVGTGTATYEVVSNEELTVEAGTFQDVFQIKEDFTWEFDSEQIDHIVTRHWLAPDVGIIKFSQEDTIGGQTIVTEAVLQSYTVK